MFDLPWDVEEVGVRVLSTIPETLQHLLNIYLDICIQVESDGLTVRGTDSIDMELQENQIYTTTGFCTVVLTKQHSVSDGTSTLRNSTSNGGGASKHAALNQRVITSVGRIWLLLADEYSRALQSRHWDRFDVEDHLKLKGRGNRTKDLNDIGHLKVNSSEQITANMRFLTAVVNDSYRVQTLHMGVLRAFERSGGVAEVIPQIVRAFQEVADRALKLVARIIFIDMQHILLDYEHLWLEPSNNIMRRLVTCVSKGFRELKGKMEDSYIIRLLDKVADVCVSRVLLFLKERSEKSARFTVLERGRYQTDISILHRCFSDLKTLFEGLDPCSEEGSEEGYGDSSRVHRLKSTDLTRQTQYLNDTVGLLTLEADTPPLATLIKSLLRRYGPLSLETPIPGKNETDNSTLVVLNEYLTALLCTLRPDNGTAISTLIKKVITDENRVLQNKRFSRTASCSTYAGISNGDLLMRVFGGWEEGEGVGAGDLPFCDIQDDAGSGTVIRSASTNQFPVTPSKTPFKTRTSVGGISTPFSVAKKMRERASEIGLLGGLGKNGATARRKNDGHALDTMRILGLEERRVDEGWAERGQTGAQKLIQTPKKTPKKGSKFGELFSPDRTSLPVSQSGLEESSSDMNEELDEEDNSASVHSSNRYI